MRIIDTIATQTASKIKDKKKANSTDSGFGALLSGTENSPTASGTSSTAGVTIPNLLGLQMAEDLPSALEQHVQHGEALLDQLNELRLMLLDGSIDPHIVSNLTDTLKQQTSDQFVPDALQDIIDEIELRAAVEVAKLERASQ